MLQIVCGALVLMSCAPVWAAEASAPTTDKVTINKAYVGTWQYPGHTVWITIKPDGKAFQCRVDTDGTTVYRANGAVKGDRIKWDIMWGEDKITLRPPGAIVLKGKYGTFHYITALEPEAEVCRNASE